MILAQLHDAAFMTQDRATIAHIGNVNVMILGADIVLVVHIDADSTRLALMLVRIFLKLLVGGMKCFANSSSDQIITSSSSITIHGLSIIKIARHILMQMLRTKFSRFIAQMAVKQTKRIFLQRLTHVCCCCCCISTRRHIHNTRAVLHMCAFALIFENCKTQSFVEWRPILFAEMNVDVGIRRQRHLLCHCLRNHNGMCIAITSTNSSLGHACACQHIAFVIGLVDFCARFSGYNHRVRALMLLVTKGRIGRTIIGEFLGRIRDCVCMTIRCDGSAMIGCLVWWWCISVLRATTVRITAAVAGVAAALFA
mmetsp:Transcript_54152/g.89640  ORF Transcript_54152/g.89640 Transcript_54152/m.89640 type:complete len:311 (+) Transcript_54152:1834-2766(+)